MSFLRMRSAFLRTFASRRSPTCGGELDAVQLGCSRARQRQFIRLHHKHEILVARFSIHRAVKPDAQSTSSQWTEDTGPSTPCHISSCRSCHVRYVQGVASFDHAIKHNMNRKMSFEMPLIDKRS